MPSTFTVTNTLGDGSVGSLAWAINQVNADSTDTAAQPDIITFNITAASDAAAGGTGFNATTGVATITPQQGLPTISNAVLLDGYTQGQGTPLAASPNTLAQGDNAVLKIQIDMSHFSAGGYGLILLGDGSTVRGLVLNDVTAGSYALSLAGRDDQAGGNFIGTDVSGTGIVGGATQLAATGIGVPGFSAASPGDTIGGTTPDTRNIISGLGTGVSMATGAVGQSNPISSVIVEGNYIGTNASGTMALGNQVGISAGGTVGGTAPGAGNPISGNVYGIDVGAGAGPCQVQGNLIGTDVTGTSALANQLGITLDSDFPVLVGGNSKAEPGARNIISGNGIGIQDVGNVPGFLIEGNYIGTDIAGTQAVSDGDGVWLNGGGTVGGTSAGDGNVISGNTIGIRIFGDNNKVQGSLIGTDYTGTKAIGNSFSGILAQDGGNNNVIGGLDTNRPGDPLAGGGNLISGNSSGVDISATPGNLASADVIEGNYIGTDITGTTTTGTDGKPLGNDNGVSLGNGATGNTVGGTTAAARNIISGNTGQNFPGGVVVGDGSAKNLVEGNYIGTDVFGSKALGNGSGGVSGGVVLFGAVNTTISGNLISGNTTGVWANSNGPGQSNSGSVIQGNLIGTDATGTTTTGSDGKTLGNGSGVSVADANILIGGTTAGQGNIIAGNGAWGVRLFGGGNNRVQGNTSSQNAGDGLIVDGPDNPVGGTAAGAGNVISGNGGDGVLVDNGATAVSIRGNSIHDNAGLGIDLGGSGVPVLNDSQGHVGPNNFQDFPILTSAVTNKAGVTIIAGSFSSPSQPNASITVDFYANAAKDPSGYGEGQIYLGTLTFTTDSKGAYTIHSFKPSMTVPVGYYVTATATDPAGNTSEFGPDVLVTSPQTASHGMALTAASSGSDGTGSSGGALVAEDLTVYVDNSNGDLTADELARIQDAVSAVDAVIEPYGAAIREVSDPSQADVTLNMDTTSAVGGYADGVLGCTTDAGQITVIAGWGFYAGSDAAQVGPGQYDFQAVVTHELGHALGLGHSADSTSVMYATLDTGSAKRSLTTADLNVSDADTAGACGLHAAVALDTPGSASLTGAETVSGSSAVSASPACSSKGPAGMGPLSPLGAITLGGTAEGPVTMSRLSVRVILVGLPTGPVAPADAGSHALPASCPVGPVQRLMGLGGGNGMAGAEPDVQAVDLDRRAAARDAFFETQPQRDDEPLHTRAADSPGMAAALGDLAGALGVGDGKDAGELAGPAVRHLAAGGPVLFALLAPLGAPALRIPRRGGSEAGRKDKPGIRLTIRRLVSGLLHLAGGLARRVAGAAGKPAG